MHAIQQKLKLKREPFWSGRWVYQLLSCWQCRKVFWIIWIRCQIFLLIRKQVWSAAMCWCSIKKCKYFSVIPHHTIELLVVPLFSGYTSSTDQPSVEVDIPCQMWAWLSQSFDHLVLPFLCLHGLGVQDSQNWCPSGRWCHSQTYGGSSHHPPSPPQSPWSSKNMKQVQLLY